MHTVVVSFEVEVEVEVSRLAYLSFCLKDSWQDTPNVGVWRKILNL
jgi:hypothetical protein